MRKALITRPLKQSIQLATQLESHAQIYPIQPIVFPTIDFRPIPPKQTELKSLQITNQKKLYIFISPYAVKYSINWLKPYLQNQDHLASVGQATKHALEQQQLTVHFSPELSLCRNKKSVCGIQALYPIIQNQLSQYKQIIILKGVGGRRWLSQQLRKTQTNYHAINCYRRTLPVISASKLNEIDSFTEQDWVIITSMTQLTHLHQMLPHTLMNKLKQCRLLTASKRIAAKARAEKFQQIEVLSETPSNQSILNHLLMIESYKQRSHSQRIDTDVREK